MGQGKRIAYVRVSTVEQHEARQLEALEKYNIDKYFTEKVSAKDTNRPELINMLGYIREGDSVYIESFSRLARNTRDLLNLVDELSAKGVNIISLKENVDTNTPTGKLMLTMIAAIYQFERDIMLERQKEGIAIAKRQGVYKGRKPKTLPENFSSIYTDYMDRKITKSRMAELCGLSRPVMDRLLDEYLNKTA